jgi:hypothetical protein
MGLNGGEATNTLTVNSKTTRTQTHTSIYTRGMMRLRILDIKTDTEVNEKHERKEE